MFNSQCCYSTKQEINQIENPSKQEDNINTKKEEQNIEQKLEDDKPKKVIKTSKNAIPTVS